MPTRSSSNSDNVCRDENAGIVGDRINCGMRRLARSPQSPNHFVRWTRRYLVKKAVGLLNGRPQCLYKQRVECLLLCIVKSIHPTAAV